SDIILDPILWSGADKSLEAFAHGRPVVTLPGSTMRSRHTYAMLQRMRIPELIAADVDDYISIAANLAQDSRGRIAIEERIAKENYVLFGDREPIGALRQFLVKASG
ncbi:MAG: glycosyltransferase, partial [Pseudomonadota bacterium]|nr:glycosyltransferase [Pseudomonadota bacterium]